MPSFLVRLTTLHWALGLSAVVHAAALTVRFVDPEGFQRVFEDTPLEVILVNAKSNEAPDKVQAIAQANLAGGGDAAQGRATSPLPYSALTAVGEDFEEMQRQLDAVQQEQTQLLAQLRQQVAQLPHFSNSKKNVVIRTIRWRLCDWGTTQLPKMFKPH